MYHPRTRTGVRRGGGWNKDSPQSQGLAVDRMGEESIQCLDFSVRVGRIEGAGFGGKEKHNKGCGTEKEKGVKKEYVLCGGGGSFHQGLSFTC